MSETQPNSAMAGEITFFSYWLPALAPGEYSVQVKPTLEYSVPVPRGLREA